MLYNIKLNDTRKISNIHNTSGHMNLPRLKRSIENGTISVEESELSEHTKDECIPCRIAKGKKRAQNQFKGKV